MFESTLTRQEEEIISCAEPYVTYLDEWYANVTAYYSNALPIDDIIPGTGIESITMGNIHCENDESICH